MEERCKCIELKKFFLKATVNDIPGEDEKVPELARPTSELFQKVTLAKLPTDGVERIRVFTSA